MAIRILKYSKPECLRWHTFSNMHVDFCNVWDVCRTRQVRSLHICSTASLSDQPEFEPTSIGPPTLLLNSYWSGSSSRKRLKSSIGSLMLTFGFVWI